MAYVLRLEPRPRAVVQAQPEPFRSFILNSLERLAAAPTRLSYTNTVIRTGQLADFKFDEEGVSLWVTVIFQYGQDEQTLFIETIKTEFGE